MIGAQLQEAIFVALAGIAGGRIYDGAPKGAQYPYITIGDETILNDGNSCNDAWVVSADIHAWSRPQNGSSKKEVKGLQAQIVAALQIELVVVDHLVIVADLENARTITDADGITQHSIITIRYEIEPAT